MNWRLSSLDRYTLVSNSDSHSSWPWRIGREANVFELNRFTYREVVESIKSKDANRLRFTIETYPDYGKYHWTGHRNCGISLPPAEAIKLGNICPRCRRQLTKGVEQRVEELADRPTGFKPEGVPGYVRLQPLSEIISAVLGVTYPGVQKVWKNYNDLVSRFSDEYSVLVDAPFSEMAKIADPKIAEAIMRVREGRIRVVAGYDGVYGQIDIFPEDGKREATEAQQANHPEPSETDPDRPRQRSLTDFV